MALEFGLGRKARTSSFVVGTSKSSGAEAFSELIEILDEPVSLEVCLHKFNINAGKPKQKLNICQFLKPPSRIIFHGQHFHDDEVFNRGTRISLEHRSGMRSKKIDLLRDRSTNEGAM